MNSKRTFLRLIAVLLLAAFAVSAFSACKKQKEDPAKKFIGEWKSRIDIAPMMIDSVLSLYPDIDMDLKNIEYKNTEITMTAVFDKNGGYTTSVSEEEVQKVIDGLIQNNWDAVQSAIIRFAAEQEGVAPEEITEEDIFGSGKIIDAAGIGGWMQLKAMIGLVLPNLVSAKDIAKDFTREGKYTATEETLTLEGFYIYNEFGYKLDGSALTLTPTGTTAEKPAEKPFPLTLEKTKE